MMMSDTSETAAPAPPCMFEVRADMFCSNSGVSPAPGPENVISASGKDKMQYWYLDHMMIRVDDGICQTYHVASHAYHNVNMQHLLRMCNARFYRLPYRENMVHVDIRDASPSANRYFHAYCQMFSAKRGAFDERSIGYQSQSYKRTREVPLDPRFVSLRMSPHTNPYLDQAPPPDLNASTSDHSCPAENYSNPARMCQLEQMRPPGVASVPTNEEIHYAQPRPVSSFAPAGWNPASGPEAQVPPYRPPEENIGSSDGTQARTEHLSRVQRVRQQYIAKYGLQPSQLPTGEVRNVPPEEPP